MSVESGNWGRVVATVAVAADRKDNTSPEDSVNAVTLLRGYSPIIGGSFPLIP